MSRFRRRFSAVLKPTRLRLERLEDRWTPAGTKYLLLASDNPFHLAGMAAQINSSGLIGDASVDTFNSGSGTPTLGFLQHYAAVLNFTSFAPTNPTALGNVLADYVDGGGRVVLATYAFSQSWATGGRIMTGAYSPFAVAADGSDFTLGSSDMHSLTGFDPASPFFEGVTESASYWVASDYTNPPLAPGATLLASDFEGNRVVAVNHQENVFGISIAAGALGINTTDTEIYRLFINSMVADVEAAPQVQAISPSLIGGPLSPGLNSLRVTFNKSVIGANNAANYRLQGAGLDGDLGTKDDVFFTLTASYNDTTHATTLKFAPLPSDTYRMTVKGGISDLAGHALNGGDFVRDFAANAPVTNYQLNLNSVVRGKLTDRLATDRWSFTVPAGEQVQLNLVSRENSDVLFDLIDPDGNPLFSDLGQTSEIVSLDQPGTYAVAVHARDSVAGGAYSFSLNQTTQTELTLGDAFDGTLVSSGQVQLFKVTIPDGNPLRVQLTDSHSNDVNEVYVRRGSPPTRGVYDYRYTQAAANQDILVPFASPGTWYVLVYARTVNTPSSFSLLAQSNQVFVTSVSPTSFPTNSSATIALSGAGFVPGTQVALTRSGGPTVNAQSVSVNSFAGLSATFNLTGVPAGTYDVRVTLPSAATGTLANGFHVVASGLAHLETKLEIPEVLGRHAVATFYVEYANTGTAPMPAPILVLQNTNGLHPLFTMDQSRLVQGLWTNALPAGFSNDAQIYASGDTPGLLMPGEHKRVAVFYAGLQQPWDFDNDNTQSYEIRIHEAGSAAAIDWNAIKDDMRPDWLPVAAWNAVFANVTAQVGPTWGDYVRTLSNNAAYLGRLGLNVTDADKLFAFSFQQALGISPVNVLATAVDAAAGTPGLPLGISRSFGNTIPQRYQLGPFGHGWNVGWTVSLQQEPDGTVVVHDSTDGQRLFKPDIRGSGRYLSQPGDTGVLRRLSGWAFELTETSGTITRFRVDGSLEYVQDINGNRITTTISAGRLTKLTHSSGAWIDITYNGANLISAMTVHAGPADATGRTTTFGYDLTNLLLTSTTGPGGTITYTYDTSANGTTKYALTSMSDATGASRLFQYDAFGRLMATFRNGDEEHVDFTYNLGAVTATDEAGVASTMFFDHRGLVARREDGLGDYYRFTYDDLNHLTRVVDSLGHEVDYTRCDCGRPTSITDEMGNTIRFTLGGANNNATALRDAANDLTQFAYDANGNLATTTYADGTFEHVVYDALGQAAQLVNRRGQTVTFTHNPAGQVTREDFPDSTFNTYTYDTRGRLQTATDAHGTTTFTYDAADRLTRVDYPNGRWLQYTYNAAGHRALLEESSGLKVHYLYDAVGRLSELKDATSVVETRLVLYTYDNAGRLKREDKGNSTYTIYAYDAVGRIASVTNYAPNDSINSKFIYGYDALGRRTSAVTNDGTWTYTYDTTGQLKHAIFDSTNVNIADQDLTYEYDSRGNRTRTIINGIESLYVANNLNEYSSVAGVNQTYDLDGNLTGDGTRQMTYDALNRVIQVVSGGNTWQYEYDAMGHRIASVFNGVRTEYLIDPSGLGNVVATYSGANTLTASYAGGLGLEAAQIAGAWDYFDADALGSIAGISGAAGSYVNTYAYDPFGGVLHSTQTIANPFQFVGSFGVMNEGNGLDFMRARFYAVGSGRFTSVDPLRLDGGDFNLYRYAGNAPLNVVDPSGLYWCFDPNKLGWGEAVGAGRDVSNDVRNGQWDWNAHSDIQNAAARHDLTLGDYHNATGGGWSDINPTVLGAHWNLLNDFGKAGGADAILRDIGRNWWNFDPGIRWCEDKKDPKKTPKPPGDQGPTGDSGTGNSEDPNDIVGPVGFGPRNFVAADRNLSYRIDFENDAHATAPAQRVLITSQLAEEFDWSTFEFTDFGFGDTNASAPAGSQHFETTLPMTFNGQFFNVEIVADFDATTGQITVTFDSIIPATQLPPDVLTGFLPPEDGSGRGQGYFDYTVRAGASVPSGTEIRSVGLVQFDRNPFIATNQLDEHNPAKGIDPAKEALITTDVGTPSAAFSVLPILETSLSFPIGWVGADETGGSGVGGYDVFVSDNNGPFSFLLHSNKTTATFTGQDRHTYRFYALATDNVGHAEPVGSPVIRQTEIAMPPSAIGDTYAVDAGKKLTVTANNGVLKNDKNTAPRRTLTAVLVSNVTKGTLTLHGDGSFTYTPGLAFDGLDQFTYKIRDNAGHESNTAVVNLTSQVISFRVDSTSLGEAGGSGLLWVDLRKAATDTLIVDYALGIGTAALGEDFGLTAGTITFFAGQRSKAIPFTINNDVVDEFDETFRVVLSNPSSGAIGRGETSVTIRDNDGAPSVGFAAVNSRVAENVAAATIEVRLSAPSGKPVTVQIRPAPGRGPGMAGAGVDYTAPPITVTFAPGETVKGVVVPLLNDAIDEPDEVARFTLTGAINASLGRATHALTIADDDPTPAVSFAGSSSSVNEAIGFVDLIVTLSGPSSQPATIDVRITGGTASSADFNLKTGRLTFAAGETTKKVRLFIINDAATEGDETLLVSLQHPSNALLGAFVGHTLTIVDND